MLEFGAQPGMRNSKQESAVDIIDGHPERRREDFMKLLRGSQLCMFDAITVWIQIAEARPLALQKKDPLDARLLMKWMRLNTRVVRHLNCDDSIVYGLLYCVVVHPLLRNRPSWVRNTGEHYSAATKLHPVTAVIESMYLILLLIVN